MRSSTGFTCSASHSRCCGTTASAARRRAHLGPRLCTVILMTRACGPPPSRRRRRRQVQVAVEDPGVREELVLSRGTPRDALRAQEVTSSGNAPGGSGSGGAVAGVGSECCRRRSGEPFTSLAVVALAVGQAEQPLLEDGVGAVPDREGEAELAVVVADAGDAVLAPAVRARAGLVVGEVVPRVAVFAVVLADSAPLALGEVRTRCRQGTPSRASRRRRSSTVCSP